MATNKTGFTDQDVREFVENYVDNAQKKADSFKLIELMKQWSGFEPQMYGPTIIGFGKYSYKYASGHEGEAPVLGFSPRKAAISLYIYSQTPESVRLLDELGKFTMAKVCIYVKKLSDINIDVLEKLAKESIRYVKENPNSGC